MQLEEEADMAKKEEEERRQRAELEAFERMTKGRRRKPRKHHQDVIEETVFEKHRKLIGITSALVIIVGAGIAWVNLF